MDRWQVAHRVFMFKQIFRHGSYSSAVRAFRVHFNLNPKDAVPSRNTVNLWVQNFENTGSVNKKKPPGRKRTVRKQENIERVRESLIKSPSRSGRKHSASLDISNRTFRRIVRNDLSFHPYKIMITQQLKPADHPARLAFAQKMTEALENGNIARESLMMSDEAIYGDI